MIVSIKRIQPVAFQPFTLTLTVETRQEFIDLSELFSYYQTLPNEVCGVFNEKHKRMQELLVRIHDALDNEDQY
jgi:hypothetical protein